MKICVLTHTFPRFPGDTPAPFMQNLVNSLSDLKQDVYILAPYDAKFKLYIKRSYKLITYRYAIFEKLHILGYSREFDSSKNLRVITYFLAPLLLLSGFITLVKLIRKEKFDVVSAHWIIPSGFIAALASVVTRVPYTVTIPGSDVYLGGKNFLFRLMVAFAARRASYVLADSPHYINELLSLGIKPKNREIIVYGADTKRFFATVRDTQVLKKLGLGNKTPIVLAVGRLVAKKGFIYLVRAMPVVFKRYPNARLVIVGDGEQRTVLQEEIQKLEISDRVILAGTINYDDLSKYYNLGSVFVMPSIRDELGNIDASPVAMMEAMACGTPVVATRFSGSQALVVEGQTGFLVPGKDSRAIARAVLKLLSANPVDMKKNVRKIAVDNFSTDVVAKRYIEVFKRLLVR